MAIVSINPATGERLREFQELSSTEVGSKVGAAAEAYAPQK